MIILFSENHNEKDIIKIIRKNIAQPHEELIITDGEPFRADILNKARIGICSDSNRNALSLLCESKTPVITCGMNSLNTVTLSSSTDSFCSLTLQRAVKCLNGKTSEPAEYPIKLTAHHQPFTVMASTVVMLLNGITPEKI